LYNKLFYLIDLIFGVFKPLSTIFQLFSWRPVLVVEEAGEREPPTMGRTQQKLFSSINFSIIFKIKSANFSIVNYFR
jgi:hypothetical protein